MGEIGPRSAGYTMKSGVRWVLRLEDGTEEIIPPTMMKSKDSGISAVVKPIFMMTERARDNRTGSDRGANQRMKRMMVWDGCG